MLEQDGFSNEQHSLQFNNHHTVPHSHWQSSISTFPKPAASFTDYTLKKTFHMRKRRVCVPVWCECANRKQVSGHDAGQSSLMDHMICDL